MMSTPNCLYCGYKIFKNGKEVFDVPKKNKMFREETSEFFSDYKELQNAILNKEYKKNDIALIVKIYNGWYQNCLNLELVGINYIWQG